ncbi:MAG TPA: hypothetical protein VKE74_19450 [Gemmataceae bacterium]|nr:hypothetical protein [Gemmataceae bacterium]
MIRELLAVLGEVEDLEQRERRETSLRCLLVELEALTPASAATPSSDDRAGQRNGRPSSPSSCEYGTYPHNLTAND